MYPATLSCSIGWIHWWVLWNVDDLPSIVSFYCFPDAAFDAASSGTETRSRFTRKHGFQFRNRAHYSALFSRKCHPSSFSSGPQSSGSLADYEACQQLHGEFWFLKGFFFFFLMFLRFRLDHVIIIKTRGLFSF